MKSKYRHLSVIFPVIFFMIATLFFAAFSPMVLAREIVKIEADLDSNQAKHKKLLADLTGRQQEVIRLGGEVDSRQTAQSIRKKDVETSLKNLSEIEKIYPAGSAELEKAQRNERDRYSENKAAYEAGEKELQDLMAKLQKAERDERELRAGLNGNIKERNALKRELGDLKYEIIKGKIEKEQVIETIGEVSCGKLSINECKAMALEQAKRNAAEQGSAVLVDSVTEVKDFQLTEDVVKTRVRAFVLSHEVLDKGFVGDSGYYYKIKAVVKGQVPPDLKDQLTGALEEEEMVRPTVAEKKPARKEERGIAVEEPAEDKAYLEAWIGEDIKSIGETPNPGETRREPVTGMEFVWVPEGCFEMGCGKWTNNCANDESPVHKVCVDGYWLGKYEVTEGQWQMVMGKASYAKKGDNYPITWISMKHIETFIQRLNSRSSDSYEFRLPTEAKWEYACRSGGKEERFAGSDNMEPVSWSSKKWGLADLMKSEALNTQIAGTKAPNGLGIYDMSGNVAEWCEDVYHNTAYSMHDKNNPVITRGISADLVVRGGDFASDEKDVRCSARNHRKPGRMQYNGIGFRLLRVKK